MKKKKMSLYMKIYISVISAFVLLLAVGSVFLWFLLDAYEATRPQYVAEDVFNRYFKASNIGELIENHSSESLAFENAESINLGVNEKYDPSKFEYFSVATLEDGSEQYAVAYENYRIAYFTLGKTNKKAGFGFKYFELKSVEPFFSQLGPITVKLPQGYKLFVNGIEADSSYITETDIESESSKYMPEGLSGLLYTKYTVSGFIFDPKLSVMTPDGREAELTVGSDGIYEADVLSDTELEKTHKDFVIKAVSEYTKFLSNDTYFGSIGQYLDKSSAVYNKVRSVEVEWVRDHYSYSISDQKAWDFIGYSDDVFSCRVSMTETLKRYGYDDYKEFIDVTLYLKKIDGKFYIYELITH